MVKRHTKSAEIAIATISKLLILMEICAVDRGNTAQFWLNLQIQYDLGQAFAENSEVYNQIPKFLSDDVA